MCTNFLQYVQHIRAWPLAMLVFLFVPVTAFSATTVLTVTIGAETSSVDYYTEGVNPTSVFPRLAQTSATTMYEVKFPVNVSIPSGGKIVILFPVGFSFASLCQTPITSVENDDINGFSAGVVSIASISCNSSTRIISITTGGATVAVGDRVRFFIQDVVNSVQARDYTTAGYMTTIETQNTSGAFLESKSSQPFFLAQAGTQIISGTAFDDNGSGLFGFANDGIKNGSEPGVSGVRAFLRGASGVFCSVTDTNGLYNFGNLSNGTYHIDIPSLVSGNFVGGPFFRDVVLSGGQNATGINFALQSSNRSVTVNISGIPSGTNLDVFAFSPTSIEFGGTIVREVLWDGNSGRTAVLPLLDGSWEIGVRSWMPKDPSMMTAQAPMQGNFVVQ